MSKDLDEMLKESPTLTFEPFPENKAEIVEVVEETPVAEEEKYEVGHLPRGCAFRS